MSPPPPPPFTVANDELVAIYRFLTPDADLENRDKKDKEAANSTTTEIWVVGGSRECGVAAVLNLETYKVRCLQPVHAWWCQMIDLQLMNILWVLL